MSRIPIAGSKHSQLCIQATEDGRVMLTIAESDTVIMNGAVIQLNNDESEQLLVGPDTKIARDRPPTHAQIVSTPKYARIFSDALSTTHNITPVHIARSTRVFVRVHNLQVDSKVSAMSQLCVALMAYLGDAGARVAGAKAMDHCMNSDCHCFVPNVYNANITTAALLALNVIQCYLCSEQSVQLKRKRSRNTTFILMGALKRKTTNESTRIYIKRDIERALSDPCMERAKECLMRSKSLRPINQ